MNDIIKQKITYWTQKLTKNISKCGFTDDVVVLASSDAEFVGLE